MTTTTGLRPLTDAEREAVTLHMQKVPTVTIAMKTDLTAAQIAAAVDLSRQHAAQSAARPAPAVPFAVPAAAPKPAASPTTSSARPAAAAPAKASPEAHLTTDALLTWAEGSGHTRALTLAARIREQLAELRDIHDQREARAKAQAEVDRLTAELEAAKETLRAAGGKTATGQRPGRPAGAAADPDRKAYLADVRAWCAANGRPVNGLGRIPKADIEAYHAANGGTPQ